MKCTKNICFPFNSFYKINIPPEGSYVWHESFYITLLDTLGELLKSGPEENCK